VRTRSHRSLRSRAFRLELLESRELMSAVGTSDQHIVQVSVAIQALHETIAGTYSGTAIASPTSEFKGTSDFRTAGTAIGPSSFDGSDSYSASKHNTVKYTNGTATLADTSGDEINVTFTGKGRGNGAGEYSIFAKGSVKGGAGTYAGAAGSFSSSGTFSDITGAFTANIKIVLKRL
jgi:hypothetical protein